MEQFTTKYYESDNRWHSFLPDETKPRKMKPIAKCKWEDLEEMIVQFYPQQEQTEKRKRITLRTLYPEWFDYKWQDTNNSGYMKRISQYWKRFYENDDIVGKWTSYPKVVEHTKSDAGYRTLYVVTSTLELFNKVKEANQQNGYTCNPEDYIFLYDGVRITFNSINKKYNHLCKELGIIKKGNHKTRKTCLTKIADNPTSI